MIVTIVHTSGSADLTGPYMHKMARTYARDMTPYAALSLPDVFNRIKNIPYRPDPPGLETLMRPMYTMNCQGFGGDCDDKAIALASWAILNRIPYRFVAVRKVNRESLHHVYPQLYIENKWVTADPTYSFNTLGRERERYAEYVII